MLRTGLVSFVFLALFLGLTLLLITCSGKQRLISSYVTAEDITELETIVDLTTEEYGKILLRDKKNLCNQPDDFRHDPERPYLNPMKTIRVNMHFVNGLDSSANFNPDTGIQFAKDFIYQANRKLAHNKKMNLPEGNNTAIDPISYQYQLTPDSNLPGDEGVYFHYEEDPFFRNYGKYKNNFDRSIIKKYAVYPDSILNIFYMVHPPDSVKSKTYKAKPAGIALGTSVKVGVNGLKSAKPWTYTGLLNHEIGHVLTLQHAWTGSDGCDDTPKHENCWNSGPAPCDGVISNNVMDYNSLQTAFTPCQIAKTNRTLNNLKSSKRRLTIKDWCSYDASQDLIITDTTSWNRHIDFRGSITVEKDAMLILTCTLAMPAKSRIHVKAGGHLILAGARIFNDCGLEWDGIIIDKDSKSAGLVSHIDEFSLENISSKQHLDD